MRGIGKNRGNAGNSRNEKVHIGRATEYGLGIGKLGKHLR